MHADCCVEQYRGGSTTLPRSVDLKLPEKTLKFLTICLNLSGKEKGGIAQDKSGAK